MNAIRIPVLQGTPAWLEARRHLVTATDIGVLLGLSPWKCEADLAAEKLGTAEPVESNVRMRIGTALEPLIAAEYEAQTGRRVRRVHGLWRHPEIEWAGASPDFTVIGERRLVEAKWSGSKSRFADGLPEDIEAQAAWQLFVSGYPVCDVAVLVGGEDLRVFTVTADEGLAASLVAVATDWRTRLAAGGPFAESNDSLKRRWPTDNGAEMVADEAMGSDVRALVGIRRQVRDLKSLEEAHEARIKTRMGDLATAIGDGFRVSWKKSKDREETDYRGLAESLMGSTPEPERAALVGPFVTVRQGARYFRVTMQEEEA